MMKLTKSKITMENKGQSIYFNQDVRIDNMAVANHKRANTTLYIDTNDINSHRIRIILAEKSVPAILIPVERNALPEELLRANPYGSLPTLIDRDLVLYEINVIAEYLDERFPHPPLLPVYPIARAKARLMVSRIEKEWYTLVRKIQLGTSAEAKNARQGLTESLVSFNPIFNTMPYFLSEEFSLLDCCIAPLLYLLPKLNIALPPSAKGIQQYAQRLFARPSFVTSIMPLEAEEYESA